MNVSKIFLSLGLFAMFFAQFQNAAAQAKANPQTVLDYFMLLPQEHLSLLEFAGKNRKNLIQMQDLKNGYLGLSSVEKEGGAQVALFRKKTREAVIGAAEFDCAPACSGSVKFLQYNAGKWRDVTAEVLPEVMDEEILAAYNRIKTRDDDQHSLADMPYVVWELPAKGTTLQLNLGDASESAGKNLMRFAWNGERFQKVNK